MGEHLYRRGKTWWGWTYDTAGERDRFSTGCTDKVAARIVLAQKERDAADPDTARRNSATLGDAIDLLVADRKSLVTAGKRSARTLDFYGAHFRPWLLFAGRTARAVATEKRDDAFTLEERNDLAEIGRKVALVDAGDSRFVDAFTLHRRTQGTSEHSIAHDRGALRAALKMAKRARIWTGDIETIFQRFDSGYEPAQKWIGHDDAERLLKAIVLPHRRAYVAFILATGAELAGVQGAQRADISKDMVRVRGTKNTNRDRLVPIVTSWQRELLAYVEKRADGKDGLLFTPWGSALRSIRAACVRANVQHMSRHALRHTFAHWLKQEGVPNSELYVAMGHSSTTMLERVYGKAEGVELAKAMAESIAQRRAALRVIEGGKRSPRTRKAPKKRRRATG